MWDRGTWHPAIWDRGTWHPAIWDRGTWHPAIWDRGTWHRGDLAAGDLAVLSIGEMAQRTGMSVAGLRNWESRYGIPDPKRGDGGRRRYRESDVRLVSDVIRRRDGGLSLGAAVREALDSAGAGGETSIFAGLRRRHPHLGVHTLDKTMLLALNHRDRGSLLRDRRAAPAGGGLPEETGSTVARGIAGRVLR